MNKQQVKKFSKLINDSKRPNLTQKQIQQIYKRENLGNPKYINGKKMSKRQMEMARKKIDKYASKKLSDIGYKDIDKVYKKKQKQLLNDLKKGGYTKELINAYLSGKNVLVNDTYQREVNFKNMFDKNKIINDFKNQNETFDKFLNNKIKGIRLETKEDKLSRLEEQLKTYASKVSTLSDDDVKELMKYARKEIGILELENLINTMELFNDKIYGDSGDKGKDNDDNDNNDDKQKERSWEDITSDVNYMKGIFKKYTLKNNPNLRYGAEGY